MADRKLAQLVVANVLADPDLLYLARGTTPLKLPAATAATFFTEKATATLDAAKRLVPAQLAANVRSSVFLRGDGVWATPTASPSGPGGGVAPTAANLSAILSQAPPDGIAGIAYSWLPKIPQDGVTGLPDSLNTLTGGVAANLDSINALMNNARATLTQAERDWRAGLVESHIPGAIVYQPPYLDLVRWHPATAGNAGLSLDVTGKSVANFGGRRGITGLGQQDDKVVFVKLDSYPTAGHFGYIRPPSGGGQVFLGVDANNNNAYQIYDPDELSPAVRTLSDASAATISWVAGDVFGFSAQAYGSTLTIVPVIFRTGGGKVQANDVAFNSANAVTHYDASSFIIQNGSSVGDVWVARHSGLGIRHSDIAHADFSDIAGTPGLGLRREGEGSDVLTQTRVVNYSAGLQSQGESVARVVDIEQWARADDVSPIPMAKLINAGASVTYPIEAYVRVAHGANVSSLSLTSGGVWSDSAQKFTTKPAASSGAVFDQSDLPADATSSGTYDYIRFRRIHREGESAVPGNAWFRLGKLDDDSAGSTGSVAAATTAALGTVFLANALSDVRSSAVPTAAQVTAALAGKAATAHSHTIANVDGLQNALDARVLTSVYTPGLAAKQDKLPDGTDEQVLTWIDGAWGAADAPAGGGSSKHPSFIRAGWFGGGRVNVPAANNIQYATPIGVERTGVGGGAKAVVASGGSLGEGVSFTEANGYKATVGRGFSLGFDDSTDDIIDFTTIGYQIDVDRGLLPTNDIVSVYFGADALPAGRGSIPNAADAGLLISFVQGRYLQIQRMDNRQWLTAAGAWISTFATIAKDLGADGVITGEFVLEVGYSKGMLIVRAGDTEIYNERLPSAPDLDGNQFGILADYESVIDPAPAGSYIGIQGFAIHDLTPEVIDPHSHAASGGGYNITELYNSANPTSGAALTASVRGHKWVNVEMRLGSASGQRIANRFRGGLIDQIISASGGAANSLRVGGASYIRFSSDTAARAVTSAGVDANSVITNITAED